MSQSKSFKDAMREVAGGWPAFMLGSILADLPFHRTLTVIVVKAFCAVPLCIAVCAWIEYSRFNRNAKRMEGR